MKKFLIKGGIFVAVLFLGAVALDHTICSGLLKMEDYRFQDYSAMLKGGMDHDVLIVGNSGAKAHYNTYLIDSLCHVSSFNIGSGYYPINIELMKYRLYEEHNKKPKLIILNLDGGTLWSLTDIRRKHQSEQFFPLVYDPVMRKELMKVGYGFKELFIPLYRFWGYQMVIKNGLFEALHLKHYVSMPAYKGFRAEEGGWDGTNFHNMKPGPVDFDPYSRSLLEHFLEECYRDSIKVVTVTSPMYHEATELLLGLDEMQDWLNSFSDRFGFPYLDYMSNLPISLDTTNFCNASHMNPAATAEFTRILCQDLNSRGNLIPSKQ